MHTAHLATLVHEVHLPCLATEQLNNTFALTILLSSFLLEQIKIVILLNLKQSNGPAIPRNEQSRLLVNTTHYSMRT